MRGHFNAESDLGFKNIQPSMKNAAIKICTISKAVTVESEKVATPRSTNPNSKAGMQSIQIP